MYEDRVLAFIDILGFSDVITNTINNGAEDTVKTDMIYNFLIKAQDLFKELYRDYPVSKVSIIENHFSDSIVISCLENENGGVFHILSKILFLCATALEKGILFRGAIVCSKLCHEKEVIFGPALVRASKMEKELAIYPRIILDDNILEIAEKHPSEFPGKSEQIKVIKKLLRMDFDGLYYINYFDGINYVVGDDSGIRVYLKPMKTKLEELKNKIGENINVKSKYLWLKENYNYTLAKYKKKYCSKNGKIKSP